MSRLQVLRTLVVVVAMTAQGTAMAQTLTGASAQKSAQADVFLLYENALIDGGLDAAAKHAAPSKVKENQEMLKAFGADGFKRCRRRRRRRGYPTPSGASRSSRSM